MPHVLGRMGMPALCGLTHNGESMNKEYKDKWITALRSGQYRQGRGVLHSGDGFCCLGVLCSVLHEDGLLARRLNTQNFVYDYGAHGDVTILPTETWVSLSIPGFAMDKLIEMNDSDRASFDVIADWIEETL